MAARLFQRLGSSSSIVKLFEIRPDTEIIVLRGSGEEAASQWLTGVVVLSLSAPMEVKDVRLQLTGQKKIYWHDPSAQFLQTKADRNYTIYRHDWEPFAKAGTLPAGNYEWGFRVNLPGTTAESVEGLPDKNIIYKLKASVYRHKLAHDLHVWKPIRIVRTLGPDALELSHAMTVENIWPNKIEYQIIIPQKAIVFGTSITINMQFTSLLKGLRIGAIKAQLVEFQDFTVDNASFGDKVHKVTREVATWTFHLEEEHYHDMLDDNGQDGYKLEGDCPLPKTLQKCLQDVDVEGIKIRHKVKFNVALHNPDGHISELRATLPVTIFISPNMPLNPDGCLVNQTPRSVQAVENVQHAPPLYGEHVLDQLYADVDTSGIMTPPPQSGMNTPFFSGSLSRSGSHDNMNDLASSHGSQNGHSSSASGAVTPAALSSRLQNLNAGSRNSSFNALHAGSGASTPHHEGDTGYFGHSTRNSSRNSEEENADASGGVASIRRNPSEFEALSKVPSYRTAIKTPVRGLSQTDAVPTYATATSRPPSPVRSTPVTTPRGELSEANGTAYVSEAMSNVGFTPIQGPSTAAASASDAERNLFLLRNRERSSSYT